MSEPKLIDTQRKTILEESAKAFSTFNIFACIQAILEGGVIYDDGSRKDVALINRACKRQMKRLFKKYDRYLESAKP